MAETFTDSDKIAN